MTRNVFLKILLMIGICMLFVTHVSANSALTHWSGSEGNGVIPPEDCPVEVMHETLTYSLNQQILPWEMDPDHYDNTFTAEYTFHNPSDQQVNALLSFPLGTSPYNINAYGTDDKNSLYEIAVNGETVQPAVRYTWKPSGIQFSLNEDLGRLHDDYIQGTFFRADLPVAEYRFRFTYDKSQLDENTYADVVLSFTDAHEKQKVLFTPEAHYYEMTGTAAKAGVYVKDGDELSVFVFGEDFTVFPEWSFYSGFGENAEEIEGEAQQIRRTGTVYQDYILSLPKSTEDITDIDFFNAETEMLENKSADTCIIEWYDSGDLMKWLQYELSFEPDETLVNTVTAPAYPDIDTGYDEPVYDYTYLLSPASSWKKFGMLDIIVNTDQYMVSSSIGTFEKTEEGYRAHFDSLPDQELAFRTCSIENPSKPVNWIGVILGITLGLIPVLAVILFVIMVIKIIRAVLKRRKNKDDF